jgi:polyhydroxyalkanoate synthesis regulator phasin
VFDVLKQSVYASIGLASLTGDKITELVNEVTQRSELTDQEIKEFAEELGQRSAKAREELKTLIDKQIDHAMIQMGLMKAEGRKVAQETKDTFQTYVDERIDETLQRMGVARSEEVVSLERRLDLPEKIVQA